MSFFRCVLYLLLTAIVGFLAGRLLPKHWLKPDKGLFRCFAFERGGRIYEKLRIRKWQSKVPDMSRLLPFMMPPKNLSGDYRLRLPLMILETCAAELIHIVLAVLGLGCLWIWPGAGGVILALVDIVLLNLPFILIQRYNRPRLVRLQQKLQSREKQKEADPCAF